MTDDEWRAVCLHLEEGWKGEMTEERRAVYATFLKDGEVGPAMEALRMLAEEGQPWLPTVPELTAAIRRCSTPAVPSWPEVWEQIQLALQRKAVPTYESIIRFIQREGFERLRMVPFFDPEHGELRIRDLRGRWEQFVDVEEQRARQQRVLGTRRAAELERGEAQRLLETSGVGLPD